MKCRFHKRDLIKDCNWCGNRMCKHCVAKKEGIKEYCAKCVNLLGSMKRARIPAAPTAPVKKTEEVPVEKKRSFVINQDGYLVIE